MIPASCSRWGRGGLFAELCRTGRVHHLEQIHRFTHRWEAEASLQLRTGDPRALDAYEAHGRIVAGPLEEHLRAIATLWIVHHQRGDTVALVASTNEHVDLLNAAVQNLLLTEGELDCDTAVPIASGRFVYSSFRIVVPSRASEVFNWVAPDVIGREPAQGAR